MAIQNLCIHISISMFLQPNHRYRTFTYTSHLPVPPSKLPLQNPCIHVPSLCFPIQATTTEPSHTHFTSMFLSPNHRYSPLFTNFIKSACLKDLHEKMNCDIL